ncbi:MAG: hypothetical protein IJ324_02175 [Lachnospiraceae bacterium]|nr:hypothetical protein [Lachnospiraceae bacterium]
MHKLSTELQIKLLSDEKYIAAGTDFERHIYDLDAQIDMLSSHADKLDYLVAIASGLLCGMMDILLVGEFDLARGRDIADAKVNEFVQKTAEKLGCKDRDIKSSVAFLEKMFPIPSDGNTPDFGGGLQHHLRDFAHHPTMVGLMFSLLTQFAEKSYGTDTMGNFLIVPVPEKSRIFIGEDVPDKIVKGTIVWFFHLISDIAGSSSTAGLGGGTGIPGPILSMAKELATLPLFKDMQVQGESVSVVLSKLFNGTLFAKKDSNGKIIKETVVKFDFRGELGALAELGRQALPVLANECIVRVFFFLRRFAMQIKQHKIEHLSDLSKLNWNGIKPINNPTLTRMLTIATGVFTAVDITEAVVTQKYWVSVNYVGVGRFAVAVGAETVNFLKIRDVQKIKDMYEEIGRNTHTATDSRIYERIGDGMNYEKLGLTLEQTEILYNLEYLKTVNDVHATNIPIGKEKVKSLKWEWIHEWKSYMESGFEGFTQVPGAKLHWYSKEELIKRVEANEPYGTWLRLVLLETMLFEPYYALSTEKNEDGKDVPSKKYDSLHSPASGYKEATGDAFLETFFTGDYYTSGYIKRLRKCHSKVLRELNEVLKTALTSLAVSAGIAIAAIITAGAFAPAIAVALVGSNFAGLSGAALTSACLAYLGGGAIAAGGLGMAGGTMAIIGGGAVLGLGVGAGVGGVVGAAGMMGKKGTILQSAKLLVSVREIFLNDEHDLEYSDTIFEQYVNNIAEIEKGIVELRLKSDIASKEEKKQLILEIKNAEDSVNAMKIAMKSMNKYKSAFAIGMDVQ